MFGQKQPKDLIKTLGDLEKYCEKHGVEDTVEMYDKSTKEWTLVKNAYGFRVFSLKAALREGRIRVA